MHSAFALAPLTLAAVLVLSGLAKLPDPGATHSMMRLLRLPDVLVNTTVARLVPWAELCVAALLLTPWRWSFALGAVGAVLLFLTFWVVIARAMTFDPRPTCGCFGRVGDHRITGRTVARNTLLVAFALVTAGMALLGHSGTGLLVDFAAGDWLWLALAVALAAVGVLVLGGGSDPVSARRGSTGRTRAGRTSSGYADAEPASLAPTSQTPAGLKDDEELDDYVRTPIPDGLLVGPDRQVLTLSQLAQQQAQLVILANCWCGSTIDAIQHLAGWRERLPQLGVPFVHTLPPWDEPRLAALEQVWWDPGERLFDALQAHGSPTAVLLGADGLLAGGPVAGVDEIQELVDAIAGQLAESEAPIAEPTQVEEPAGSYPHTT